MWSICCNWKGGLRERAFEKQAAHNNKKLIQNSWRRGCCNFLVEVLRLVATCMFILSNNFAGVPSCEAPRHTPSWCNQPWCVWHSHDARCSNPRTPNSVASASVCNEGQTLCGTSKMHQRYGHFGNSIRWQAYKYSSLCVISLQHEAKYLDHI